MSHRRRVQRWALLLGAGAIVSCGRSTPGELEGDSGLPPVDVWIQGELRHDGAPGDIPAPLDARQDGEPDSGPAMPDLGVQSFTATASGATVTYTVKYCNLGTASSAAFAVDLYYQSKTPPAPKQKGDQAKLVGPIAKGTCAVATMQRPNTPIGAYSSWVQLDSGGAIAESNEANNIGGPVQVAVKAPPMPDLVIQAFDAKLVGTDLVYDVQICNVGTVPAFLFRVDIYYNRLLEPGVLQIGDQNAYLLTLAAGDCEGVSRTYKNVPVGLYNSFAFVDTLGTVAESSETNNSAGPKVLLVTAPTDCVADCVFATSCGLFKLTEYTQCLTWCTLMTPAVKQCVNAAVKAQSCTALKACNLPPPPPPPPPPWACVSLCNFLINPCKLVPQNGLASCSVACLSLPSTRIQCGVDAMNKQQCLQTLLCVVS
jgi:hypothetical protein